MGTSLLTYMLEGTSMLLEGATGLLVQEEEDKQTPHKGEKYMVESGQDLLVCVGEKYINQVESWKLQKCEKW